MLNKSIPVTPWYKCNRIGCGWWTTELELLQNHQVLSHEGETMLDTVLPTGAACPQCNTGEGRQRNIYVEGKMGRECNNCQTQWMCVVRGAGKQLPIMVPGGALVNELKLGGSRPGPREHTATGTFHSCLACGHEWPGSLVARKLTPPHCPECGSKDWNKFKPNRIIAQDKKDGYCFKCRGYRESTGVTEDLIADNGRKYRQSLCQECGAKMVRMIPKADQSAATSLS